MTSSNAQKFGVDMGKKNGGSPEFGVMNVWSKRNLHENFPRAFFKNSSQHYAYTAFNLVISQHFPKRYLFGVLVFDF